MKKFISLLIVLSGLTITAQDEFGKISFNKAVNISGKQRMLGQKMAKSYVYLLENPTNEKVKRDLLTSKVIFEKHNEVLKKYSVSKETTNKIKEVEKVWEIINPIFEATPNIAGGKKVVQVNSLLLSKADAVVKSIILDAESGSQALSDDILEENIELKNIINISGKQRMLAQRLALYYFANTTDLKNEQVSNNLKTTYDNFENAITELLVSSFNNVKIDDTLGQAMTDWNELKNHKKEFFSHKMSSDDILLRTNNLTNAFNKLTSLYEKVKID